MAAPVRLPRVLDMLLCDHVRANQHEESVFDLIGVRYHLLADAFPHRCRLGVYFMASCAWSGAYQGHVTVFRQKERERTNLVVVEFALAFQQDDELSPFISTVECEFPEPDEYQIEVRFFDETERAYTKWLRPFFVMER